MPKKLVINFTPTGMIPTKKETPFVPVEPNEIIEQTIEAYELGITMVHLHARDENQTGTYKAAIYEKIFSGIRKFCPDLVLCASLSGRNFQEIEKRTEVLSLQPDMGSLTLGSLNFVRSESVNSPQTIKALIDAMDKYGVKPELECFDMGMINYSKYLIEKSYLKPPYYYNILVGNIASAQADLVQMGCLIKELPADSFWALAGLGEFQLSTNMIAIASDGGVRVGLEDNIWFDSEKKELATNLSLLQRIHKLADLTGREVMSPKEFGELGFYNDQQRK